MSRAIFVELLGGIGDVVFILPALDRLRAAAPGMVWDVFTFPPGSELLSGDPRVARVIEATRSWTFAGGYLSSDRARGQPVGAGAARRTGGEPSGAPLHVTVCQRHSHPPFWYELAQLLSETHYDLVVSDTRHSGIHDLIESSDVGRAVTQLWAGARPDEPIPGVFVRRLVEEGLVGDVNGATGPSIFLGSREREQARDIWRQLGIAPESAIVLNPNAGLGIKRWSHAAFVELGRALRREGFEIVCLAGDESGPAASPAKDIVDARLLSRLPLHLTAACLEPSACFVSGDSGLAHVAGAVGTPVVAIYGPTWARRYGVAGQSANLQSPFDCAELRPTNFTLQPCWAADCCVVPGKRSCCDDLSVESVLRAVLHVARFAPSEGRRHA
jgi:ADP-heptose:LPS heptosyltransferase